MASSSHFSPKGVSERNKNREELEDFSARVAVLRKKAMTPRKKAPPLKQRQMPKYKEPVIPSKGKIVVADGVVMTTQYPLELAIEEIREALEHERNGCHEVALNKYYKVAEKLTNSHPSYPKILKRIEYLEQAMRESGLSYKIPDTPAQFLNSAIKSQPAPFFPPKKPTPLKNPQFDHVADDDDDDVVDDDDDNDNDNEDDESELQEPYESPIPSPMKKITTIEVDTQTDLPSEEEPDVAVDELEVAVIAETTPTIAAAASPPPPPQTLVPNLSLIDKEGVNQEVRNLLERQIVDILNNGTIDELVKLPGIGPKRAQYIIEYREFEEDENEDDDDDEGEGQKGFNEISDLEEIGMSKGQVEKLKLKLITFQLMENK